MGEYEHLEQILVMESEKFSGLRSRLEISTGKFTGLRQIFRYFFLLSIRIRFHGH